jgi:chemotaxis protein methyltransferase CheR
MQPTPSPIPDNNVDPAFARFSQFIARELGIKMPPEKSPLLMSRLRERIQDLKLGGLEDYQRYLFELPDSSAEWDEFIDRVTTNKTDFFREPGHFDYLSGTVLPALAAPRGPTWQLKLWCAGCSSGEETYTLAMTLSEYAQSHPGFDYSIFATDISTRVLALAQTAIYPQAKIDPVPTELRRRYLLRGEGAQRDNVRIVPELRQKTRFSRLNFMNDHFGVSELFDVIFFRNVMIYFERETQQAVLTKMCRQLKPGGYLFVGHAESLMGLKLPLQPMARAVFRRT